MRYPRCREDGLHGLGSRGVPEALLYTLHWATTTQSPVLSASSARTCAPGTHFLSSEQSFFLTGLLRDAQFQGRMHPLVPRGTAEHSDPTSPNVTTTVLFLLKLNRNLASVEFFHPRLKHTLMGHICTVWSRTMRRPRKSSWPPPNTNRHFPECARNHLVGFYPPFPPYTTKKTSEICSTWYSTSTNWGWKWTCPLFRR